MRMYFFCISKGVNNETSKRADCKSLCEDLLIFLFGWSCAVFSYSDVIYKKAEIVSKNVVIDKGDV